MNLRKISIIASILSVVLFIVLFSMWEEVPISEDSKATDDPTYGSPLNWILVVLLFAIPAFVAGIVASFIKTVKFQIIAWAGITFASWSVIIAIVIMMLINPVLFGIPENYWGESNGNYLFQ